MSELISGKEALIALANDRDVEYLDENLNEWVCMDMAHHFKRKFRLKPRTVNLNGVDVGQLRTAMWCINCPKEVTLEFKTEDDAHHFYANALKIFNGI